MEQPTFNAIGETLKLLQEELQSLKQCKEFSESSENENENRKPKQAVQQLKEIKHIPEASDDGWSAIRQDRPEPNETSTFVESSGSTPVHTRLFRAGLEQQAKLEKVRAQLEGRHGSTGSIPKINETSRKIVEANRQRSKLLQASGLVQNRPKEETWREYATQDGYLYYYNETTRETRWERPENARIIPYVKKDKGRSAYSVENAKANLSSGK